MKFLEKSGNLKLPVYKNQPDVILRRAKHLKSDLDNISNQKICSNFDKKNGSKGKSGERVKCFDMEIPESAFITLQNFTELENEILVKAF